MSEEHRRLYFSQPEPRWKFYRFYHVQDDEDCLKKFILISLTSGAAGCGFGLLAGMTSTTIDNPALFSNVAMSVAKYGLPMFAMGGMFASTLCTVAWLRGKSDPFNHFAAGLSTGAILGSAVKSQKAGWTFGLAVGMFSMIFKAMYDAGLIDFETQPLIRHETFFFKYRMGFGAKPCYEGDPRI